MTKKRTRKMEWESAPQWEIEYEGDKGGRRTQIVLAYGFDNAVRLFRACWKTNYIYRVQAHARDAGYIMYQARA